ncbi:MAG: phage portal protein [Frankiales bacterium]|nr:phage portal protein [Frankiales bacterium]
MSLLRRTSPTPEKRSVSYQDVWGSGGDWESYKTQASMTHVAVYACARLISSKVAGCPIEVFRELGDGTAEKVRSQPIFRAPFRRETPGEWKYRAVNSLVLRGNTYGLPLRGPNLTDAALTAFPSQVAWLQPDLVTVNDAQYPDVGATYHYRAMGPLSDSEIIHMATFVEPGSVRGLSPIGQFRKVYEAGLAAQQYGSDWFDTGGQPSGVLETDQALDDVEANTLRKRWTELRQGGGIAVLGQGAKYKGIQVSPNESQFLETQRFSISQVARIFGVPPEMIGGDAGNSLTYANREQRAIDFVTFTLAPYITALEEHFTRLIPAPYFVKLNTEQLLAGDLKSRLEARAIGIASHQLTPTEARFEEGKRPLTPEQLTELAAVPITITPNGKLKSTSASTGDTAEPGAAA